MGKLYQLNLSNLVITHKHFGKMMNIEIFSNDFDKVIKSSVATGRTTYENAIHYLLPWRIQIRSATPVDSMNEGGMLRAVDQQLSVHSQW